MPEADRKRGDSTSPFSPPPPRLDFEPIRDPKLRPRDCQVLWALAWWAWGSKPYLWASDATIAALLGCSKRTVAYAIRRLEAAGYITRHVNDRQLKQAALPGRD